MIVREVTRNMPIKHTSAATVITGDSINYFAICTQKAAVKLEIAGIKMTRGPVIWKRLREHYQIAGTNGRKATREDVYAWLCAKVAELRPQQEHITTDAEGRIVRAVGGVELS